MPNPLKTLLRSITDLSSYHALVKQPLHHSLVYFSLVYFLFSIGVSAVIIFTVIPEFHRSLTGLSDSFSKYFPPQAILTIQNGSLSVQNTPEPITIPLAQAGQSGLNNFLVINTATPSADIVAYSTHYLANKNALTLITIEESNTYQSVDWPNLPEPLTLTAATLSSQITALTNLLRPNNYWLWLVITPLLFIFFLASRLLFITIYTLPITLLGIAANRPYRYGRLFGLGLHTVIIAEIVSFLARTIYQLPLPSIFAFAYLGITTIVLISLPSKNTR